MNKQHIFGIYDFCGGIENFRREYAITSFEAHKHCINIIKAKYDEYTKSNTSIGEIQIFWYGQRPEKDGIYITYGLPGPDKSHIDIIKYETIRSWLGSQYTIESKIYSIYYRPIDRVNVPTEKIENKPIVKSEDKKIVRDLNVPHDALLAQIEKYRKD